MDFSGGDAVFVKIFCGVAVFRGPPCPPPRKKHAKLSWISLYFYGALLQIIISLRLDRTDCNQYAIPLFYDAGILPLQFSYYELTANLMFDIRFETCFKTFLIFIPIIPDHLLRTTFTHKTVGSLFN